MYNAGICLQNVGRILKIEYFIVFKYIISNILYKFSLILKIEYKARFFDKFVRKEKSE